MNTYFVRTQKYRGFHIVDMTQPSVPHYVVKAATKGAAEKLVKAYRIGHQWAVEQALAGNIRIEG